MHYKYILLDFDGTILDSRLLERNALKMTFDFFGTVLTDEMAERFHELNIKYWALFEAGEITATGLREGRFNELSDIFSLKHITVAKFNEKYLFSSGEFAPTFPGTLDCLEKLAAKSELYMVTNGFTEIQERKVKKSNVGKYFRGIFVAEEVGLRKPDVKYFEKVYNLIGGPDKKDIIIVGDSIMADIKGGCNFGIDTCWFNPEKVENTTDIKPTYTIEKLDELFLI